MSWLLFDRLSGRSLPYPDCALREYAEKMASQWNQELGYDQWEVVRGSSREFRLRGSIGMEHVGATKQGGYR